MEFDDDGLPPELPSKACRCRMIGSLVASLLGVNIEVGFLDVLGRGGGISILRSARALLLTNLRPKATNNTSTGW